ncbi:hypothetical protein MYX75_04720 [Acidobacteria bacterium AH-259-A15]|nr:hypothetical protein [Acidobacteria bacterium AH-259-A15]
MAEPLFHSSDWVSDLVKYSAEAAENRKAEEQFQFALGKVYPRVQAAIKEVCASLRSKGKPFHCDYDYNQHRLLLRWGNGKAHNLSVFFSRTRPPIISTDWTVGSGHQRDGTRQWRVEVDLDKNTWSLMPVAYEQKLKAVSQDISAELIYKWVAAVIRFEADAAES